MVNEMGPIDPELIFMLYRKIFIVNQRFDLLLDRFLSKDNLTAKQFQLAAVIEQQFDGPPSVSEVANVLDTSHQNIKAIANKLQKKGFIQIEKDPKDRRRQLLKLTETNNEYWRNNEGVGEIFIINMFNGLNSEELLQFNKLIDKLILGTETQYRSAKTP